MEVWRRSKETLGENASKRTLLVTCSRGKAAPPMTESWLPVLRVRPWKSICIEMSAEGSEFQNWEAQISIVTPPATLNDLVMVSPAVRLRIDCDSVFDSLTSG